LTTTNRIYRWGRRRPHKFRASGPSNCSVSRAILTNYQLIAANTRERKCQACVSAQCYELLLAQSEVYECIAGTRHSEIVLLEKSHVIINHSDRQRFVGYRLRRSQVNTIRYCPGVTSCILIEGWYICSHQSSKGWCARSFA